MKQKNKGVTLSDVKGYYTDSVTETVWYWQRERHRAMDRIENLDIDPCKYTQLIFDKDTKGEPLKKMVLEQLDIHRQNERKLDLKLNSKLTQKLTQNNLQT